MIDDGDCGAIGEMRIGMGNRSTQKKPAPAPLCPPKIPHDLSWVRIRAAAMGSQQTNRLTYGAATQCSATWNLNQSLYV
jgi:hypothetical protein